MEKLLTAKEVAEILNCHKQTVYRNGDLPCINIPGVGKRFKESELTKYLEQKSTFLNKDYPGNLPFKSAEPILSLGGDSCEMPKGKNKTRYNFGFGAIYQRKTKQGKIRWYLDYRDGNGKRIQNVAPLATTKDEAVLALREEVRRIFDDEHNIKRERQKIKFNELVEVYLDNYAKVLKRSWKCDHSRLEAHMKPYFGELELGEITPLLIEKYRVKRLESDVTKSTVNREISIMKKMFNLAIDWNMLDSNPALKVKLFSEKGTAKERILTNDEEVGLLKESPDYLKAVINTALNTGMRRGEVLNLRWKQVDFEKRFIKVEHTKNETCRIIPINDSLYYDLLEIKKQKREGEYVFPNPETGKPYLDLRGSFKSACTRAGIQDLRFHDLRHTFASRLVEKGIDLITVKDLLGHSSVKITERYTHSFQDQKRKAVNLLHNCDMKRSTEKVERLTRLFSVN